MPELSRFYGIVIQRETNALTNMENPLPDARDDASPAGIPAGMRKFRMLFPVVSLVPRSTTGYRLRCLRHQRPILMRVPLFVRAFASTLEKGDLPACVAHSIWSDPFITTACLRRGAFNGMTRRDWWIFSASWLIANGWWALACFGGTEVVSSLWRWLAPP